MEVGNKKEGVGTVLLNEVSFTSTGPVEGTVNPDCC